VDTLQKTVRINLLQGLVVCARCGRRLRIQTPKRGPTYYRETPTCAAIETVPISANA
jgi:hypothetical protein